MTATHAALTAEASPALAQLAKDALDEEQYDMMVDSLDQLATFGFHPPPELIRALFVIILSTPPETASSHSAASRWSNRRRGLLASVQSGPDAATIADAVTLLEKLLSLAGPKIIFHALPPHCAALDQDEERVRDAYLRSTTSKSASRSPVIKRKRKAGRGIRHIDDGSDDDESDSDGSNGDIGDFTHFTRRLGHMLASKSIWDVLVFDAALVERRPERKRESHRELDEEEDEGEAADAAPIKADQEATWRALRILIRAWGKQLDATGPATELNLLKQITAPPAPKGKKGKNAPRRSEELAKVFAIICAGFTSPAVPGHQEQEWEILNRHRLENRRQATAIQLSLQLFRIFDKGSLSPKVIVEGIAEDVLLQVKCTAVQRLLSALGDGVNLMDTWNITWTMLLYLEQSGMEEEFTSHNDALRPAFDELREDLLKDDAAPKSTKRLVEDFEDVDWLCNTDFGALEHDVLLATYSEDVQKETTVLLNRKDWRLPEQAPIEAPHAIGTRANASKGKRAAKDVKQAELSVQALALALKIKSEEIDFACSRCIVRAELIRIVLRQADPEGLAASVRALVEWCASTIHDQVGGLKDKIERCLMSISGDMAEAEDLLEKHAESSRRRGASPNSSKDDGTELADKDAEGPKTVDIPTGILQCRNAINSVNEGLRVLCICKSPLEAMLRPTATNDVPTETSPAMQIETVSAKTEPLDTHVPTATPSRNVASAEQYPPETSADMPPSLSQSSAKTVDTIVLSSGSEDDDVVIVHKVHKKARHS